MHRLYQKRITKKLQISQTCLRADLRSDCICAKRTLFALFFGSDKFGSWQAFTAQSAKKLTMKRADGLGFQAVSPGPIGLGLRLNHWYPQYEKKRGQALEKEKWGRWNIMKMVRAGWRA
jgi:hypothetical protein